MVGHLPKQYVHLVIWYPSRYSYCLSSLNATEHGLESQLLDGKMLRSSQPVLEKLKRLAGPQIVLL